jgi:prepilin-type N-terminal cleavage/methylation domain-containing protein
VTSRTRAGFRRLRSGFTLVEALVVVVLLGLMAIIGFPRMSAAMVKSDLRGARTTMINLVATARAASVQSNRVTWIKREGNSAYVAATPRWGVPVGVSTADTIGVVRNLGATYSVTMSGADSIQFDPRGFGSWAGGGGTSITVTRGGYSEAINIDGLGRVTK